ncbi:acylneuraminate cytidylyltransferase [Lutibacter sp. HS1-25]|uniref:acylneuraminate cytidylyltransferase family protein n=1 Tax=Lutibacter sp. HS1-25 TaxID=2485000 RepID=UPI0010104D2D|nr:acylneuraminate cytidylyltransferase [Lutibacter sp. HS1-25]RXP52917.1 acylneuraminate cytidylyltransferase [Lutibacter sp. HS1-25]
MKNTLADIGVVIPVREGSSRIKNKVMLPFGTDESLLEWKIKQMKEIVNNEQIIISTDSPKLIDIAIKNDVQFKVRDKYLCEGHVASFNEVIKGVVKAIDFKHIAWVTVVVPLMKPIDYLKAFTKYIKIINEKNKDFDSLLTVNLLKEYFWDDNGPLNYCADKNHTVSQDLPNFYRVTNALYMYNRESILNKEYFIGSKPYKFEVDKLAGIDIDEIEDYNMALNLLNYYNDTLKKNN